MIYRFFSYRKLYHKLSEMPSNIEDTLISAGTAPLSTGIDQLILTQYHLYQSQIERYKRKQKEHLEFIYQWAHQMKTPISVIHLILQENEGEAFENIRLEMERLNSGLNMALNFARMEEFEKDFSVETILLSSFVPEVISEEKRYFIKKRIYPEVRIDSDFTVISDRKWLKLILKQLLINAVKYTVEEDKTVTVAAYRRGNSKVLEVSDQGIGISPQDIRRVFEPFYTGVNGREFGESTGMGLYLVNEACKNLQHEIEIDSKISEGTSIRIVFSA